LSKNNQKENINGIENSIISNEILEKIKNGKYPDYPTYLRFYQHIEKGKYPDYPTYVEHHEIVER
jgi:hypothetical protein